MQIKKSIYSLLGLGLVSALALTSCVDRASSRASDEPLKLDSIVREEVFSNEGDSLGQSLKFSLKYVYPLGDTILANALAREIFPSDLVSATTSPGDLVEAYRNRIWEDFAIESNGLDSLLAELSDFAPWELRQTNEFVYQDKHLVSVVMSQYTFTGGAHGYYGSAYICVDRATGRALSETDLFVEDYETELNQIIRQRLMHQYNASTDEELEQEGFFSVGDISANGNFYLTDAEMIYCYNAYEIAPYSMGQIIVKIPYDLLSSILRSGSVLEAYV
ncbi:MAG: DUF3298 domain-containing protein [Porphyromonadaceae bacterium]|nr:DUF3298 domain-containing protein [Porphyromonadaceae bacterium]